MIIIFFDSEEFLNNGGFQKIAGEEQALLKRQKELQNLKEKEQSDKEELEKRIKRATLVSNRIALISAVISLLRLAFSI